MLMKEPDGSTCLTMPALDQMGGKFEMNIAVCIKRIPKTGEADIFIEKDGKDIKKDHLVFYLNDQDGYAVREAALLKEEPM